MDDKLLLPCPFCGGEADIEEISGNPFTNEPYTWAVGCKDCNIGWYKETKEDAIAAWNRRADVAPVVRGEWEVAIGYDPNKKVQCQNCYKMAYEPTPYCPNCGAKMEANQDE